MVFKENERNSLLSETGVRVPPSGSYLKHAVNCILGFNQPNPEELVLLASTAFAGYCLISQFNGTA